MMWEKILNILFPPRCPACLAIQNENKFCCDCLDKIKIFDFLFCPKCFNRLPDFKKKCHPEEKFILGAATDYNEFIQKAIWNLKFNLVKDAAEPISNLLINYFKTILNYYLIDLKNFIVVPIPISLKRLKERGFNQSELIAGFFANYFNLPLEKEILLRVRHSKPQSEIKDFEKRKLNVQDSFDIKAKTIDKNIILIDDVFTSGATMREAVFELKKHNIKKIIGLVISRVP